MDEIIRDFLIESHEGLDQLDKALLSLEQDPTDSETLNGVFRTTHTIKGTCGFFGFSKLESVAHVGESLLALLRDKKLLLNQEIATGLLAMVDAFREILSKIEVDQTEGDTDYTALIGQLNRLQRKEKSGELSGTQTGNPPADLPLDSLGNIFIHKGQATVAEVEAAALQQQEGDPRRLGEILVEQGAVKPQEVVEALKEQAQTRSTVAESNIRVDVRLLDNLMNLVGGAGAGPQPGIAVHRNATGQCPCRHIATAEPDHHRTAGRCDENADAADRQRLVQVSARGARLWLPPAANRFGSRWKARRPSWTRLSSNRSKTP